MPRPLLLALAAAPLCAQLQVAGSLPPRYGALQPMQSLAVQFAQPVQPATVTAQSFQVLGQWSGPTVGSLAVASNGLQVAFQPLRPWFPGETVTVTLTSSITNLAGQPLAHGYWLPFTVATAPGTRQFTNVQTIQLRHPGEGTIGTYGIFAGDVDRDGSPDITAMNEISNDLRLLRNSGCGTFSPGSMATIPDPGQWPSPHAGADFDNDGWLDVVTGNQNSGAVSVYRNSTSGTWLPPVSYPTGGYVHGVAVADFNGDGWPDIAATNTQVVCVFLNLGNGTFGPPTTYDVGNNEDNVGVLDCDEDGHPDLVIGNFSSTMAVLLGNGDGTFRPGITITAGGLPFHQAIGDVNGDHHADVLFANRGTNTFSVLLGDGAGNFAAAVTYAAGQAPASISLGDLDGDGDLDVVVSNYSSGDYTLWFNRGDGTFELPQTLPAVSSGSCCTLVDFDRDGVLDLIGADETADVAVLYRQHPAVASNTQAAGCGGSARFNQRADGAGFGGSLPVPAPRGSLVAMNVSGPDGAVALDVFGVPLDPGLPLLNLGLANIDFTYPCAIDDVALDGQGEVTRLVMVPTFAAPGWRFAHQALVLTPSLVLTNPQAFVVTP
jgi:hypothetical protein